MAVIQFSGELTQAQIYCLQKVGDSMAEHINNQTQEVLTQYPGLTNGGAADVCICARARVTRQNWKHVSSGLTWRARSSTLMTGPTMRTTTLTPSLESL